MNGVSMGDRLLHVMVQNPAARGRMPMGNGGASGGLSLTPPSSSGLPPVGPSRVTPSAVMQAAANSMGLNASTLASLQVHWVAGCGGSALAVGGAARCAPRCAASPAWPASVLPPAVL